MEVWQLKKLKFFTIVFTIFLFTIIVILRLYSAFFEYTAEKEKLQQLIFKQTKYIYNSKINTINRSFVNRLISVVSQKKIKEVIKNKDTKELYEISERKFNTLKRDFSTLNYMHYYLPNNKLFLAVQKKDNPINDIDVQSTMVLKAIETLSTQIGFESGEFRNDTIMYKVAIPIVEGEKLLAIIELGIDTKGILTQIDRFFKASLDQKVLVGFLFQKNGVIHNSSLVNVMLEKIDFKENAQDISIKDKRYFVFSDKTHLKDFNGTLIGSIVYGFDVTNIEEKFLNNILVGIIKPLGIMFLVIFMLQWLFNYIIKESRNHTLKLRNIIDNQNGIIVVTNGKKIIEANNSFLNFFNVSSLESFLEQSNCICERFETKDGYLQQTMDSKNWLEYLQANEDLIHKAIIKNKDGKECIFQVNYKSFTQDNEIEYVVTFEDITLLQEEIEKNRQKDQQLVQQSRLAQMGEMISMIAHQWRQPLAAISSTSNAINIKAKLNKLDKEQVFELSKKITEYSKHLSETIDDFREFFRSNKQKKNITFLEVISSVLGIIEISITNKNILLEKEFDSNVVFYTYPNELKQVLLNLIKNAEDVLLDREIENPKIKIETIKNKLIVSDNGGGVEEGIIEKIFDPYFSTKEKKDGTGLGLYMSKMIIEDHCCGKLTVSNNTNGAVFIIELEESYENK